MTVGAPVLRKITPPLEDRVKLRTRAAMLREANDTLSRAKKMVDSCKAELARWLLEKRQLDIETLAIGEGVLIEGVVLIKIGKQRKLDAKALLAAEPKIYAKFERDIEVTKFDPLA